MDEQAAALNAGDGATRAALFDGPGRYWLDLRRASSASPFLALRLTADADPPVVATLPAPPRAHFLVHIRRHRVAFEFHAVDVEEVRVRRLGPGSAAGLLRWRRKDLRLRGNLAEGVRVMPLFWAGGEEAREFASGLRLLNRWGFGLGTRSFQETPALFEPAPEALVPAPARGQPQFGVHLHLYYPDLWPGMRAHLAALSTPFELLVTTPPENAALAARVAIDLPGAEVRLVENRGRDVGPFIELLGEGRFDSWPLILKIHGKRSGLAGPRALLGDVWRKANIDDLAGDDGQVRAILARFAAEPRLGMVGSSRFRLPDGPVYMRDPFGTNRETALALAARMGIAPDDFRLDFYAGTMFWLRPRMLARLKSLGLRIADFPAGAGPEDGTLHHAIERLFGALAAAEGMTIEDAPGRYRRRPWR